MLLWGLWIGAGLSLDLAAWAALRAILVLAADPPDLDFMIRNDDQSPRARKLACARLGRWAADALRQAKAAPENAEYRREAARALSSERDAGCR